MLVAPLGKEERVGMPFMILVAWRTSEFSDQVPRADTPQA